MCSGRVVDVIIRWLCEKCGKKWIYPVQKCIYCRGPITKRRSAKAKIIGITKVNIPSPMHPLTPYNIILLEDESGNRMPKKVMKDYKIGEMYEVQPAKAEGAVVISRIKYDVDEALRESINLLGGINLDPQDSVLLKVSCIEPAYPYQAVSTNPKLLESVIGLLKEKGVGSIAVGEQAMLGNDTMDAAAKAGILDVCKKNDIPFIDLGKAEQVEREHDGMVWKLARDAVERKVIDIPTMKAHSQLGIAGAVENLLRVFSAETQKALYAKGIHKMLPQILGVVRPLLCIGDAVNGMQGNGPTSLGEPAFLNLILASRDAVALDRVFVEIGMFPVPEWMEEAGRGGAGQADLRKIEAVNYEVDAVKYPLRQPEKGATAHPRIKIVDGEADPHIFNTALRMAQKLVGLSGEEVSLVIGAHFTSGMVEGRRRLVLYGKDAIAKGKGMGIEAVAELTEDMPEIQRVVFLRSILENPDKKKLGIADAFRAKLAMFSQKRK